MRLADEFCRREVTRKAEMFYLWGHSYEFNDNNNWYIMEGFLKAVSNKADIWYATNGEIYNYCTAYSRLSSSADGKRIHNPSAQSVFIYDGVQTVEIPSGKTVNIN